MPVGPSIKGAQGWTRTAQSRELPVQLTTLILGRRELIKLRRRPERPAGTDKTRAGSPTGHLTA